MNSEAGISAQPGLGSTAVDAGPAHLRHIPELDGIRGMAALVVIFHHLCYSTMQATIDQPGWPRSIHALYRASQFGDTGVDLFFVLSGFLISSILLKDRRNDRYYQDFYWKRALRILPLYVLCLLVVLIFEHATSYVLLAALFVVNFASVFHIQGVGPFWTLAIEEQFYLLWPTVVRRKTVAQVQRWAIAMALSAVVLRFLFASKGHHNYFLTFLRWDALAFGALLACGYHLHGPSLKLRHSWDRALGGTALAGLLIFLCMHLVEPPAMRHAWLQTGVTLMAGSCIGLVIAHSGSRWLAPLRSPVATFFGLISYALYMLHLFLIMICDHFYGPPQPGDVSKYWIRLFAVVCGGIAASVASRYLIELPAMSLRRFVLRHPNPGAKDAHPPLPLAPQ